MPTLAEPASEHNSAALSPNSHFLHAGQVYVSAARETIVLILGSCVAVCLWDSISGIGGATHYLLPSWDGRGTSSARYGNVAISALLQKLADAGARHDQLRAKVFGGGCLFDSMRDSRVSQDHLGGRNVEIAKDMLTKERIPIISSEVGGERGKRIIFHTDTGEAIVKEL
ncbi:MAG TPA: chemotaxis protein CheD [Candidatus Angelobacter sp.]|nr:chemotaxis protein CheD [Candidatus Angelobacter sp.]